MGRWAGMKAVAIIPARGGSKRIPGKNIRTVGGKPLLAHTVLHARAAQSVTKTYVTTDSPEIARVAEEYGASVILRPPELAGDEASSEAALVHALRHLRDDRGEEYDLVVFLQCTCPIRRPDDVDGAVSHLVDTGSDSLLSVVPVHLFLWDVVDGAPVSTSYDYRHRPRSQELAPRYVENGSIFVFRPWVLAEHGNRLGGRIVMYEMDRYSLVDIDDEIDLELCEARMELARRRSEGSVGLNPNGFAD